MSAPPRIAAVEASPNRPVERLPGSARIAPERTGSRISGENVDHLPLRAGVAAHGFAIAEQRIGSG